MGSPPSNCPLEWGARYVQPCREGLALRESPSVLGAHPSRGLRWFLGRPERHTERHNVPSTPGPHSGGRGQTTPRFSAQPPKNPHIEGLGDKRRLGGTQPLKVGRGSLALSALETSLRRGHKGGEGDGGVAGSICTAWPRWVTLVPSFPEGPGRPCSPGGPGGPEWPLSPIWPVSPADPCGRKQQGGRVLEGLLPLSSPPHFPAASVTCGPTIPGPPEEPAFPCSPWKTEEERVAGRGWGQQHPPPL